MIASHYEKHSHIQRDLLNWGWGEVKTFLSECSHVLEVGAGTGLMTRRLVNITGAVTAIDCCPDMCMQGKKSIPQALWKQGDAFKLDEVGQYDAIASSSFLHWVNAPDRVLQNWRNALVPGGRVAALFFLENTAKEFYSLGGSSPVDWMSLKSWSRFFTSSGFDVITTREKMCSYTFSSVLALLVLLRATGTPARLRLAKNVGLRKLISDYEKKYCATETGILSSWNFGLVLAQRD